MDKRTDGQTDRGTIQFILDAPADLSGQGAQHKNTKKIS